MRHSGNAAGAHPGVGSIESVSGNGPGLEESRHPGGRGEPPHWSLYRICGVRSRQARFRLRFDRRDNGRLPAERVRRCSGHWGRQFARHGQGGCGAGHQPRSGARLRRPAQGPQPPGADDRHPHHGRHRQRGDAVERVHRRDPRREGGHRRRHDLPGGSPVRPRIDAWASRGADGRHRDGCAGARHRMLHQQRLPADFGVAGAFGHPS